MAGQAYPVLKKWKLHRGLLFDRQVLNSTPKMLQHISSLNVQTVVPIPQYFHRTWQMKGSAADRIAEWIGQEVSLPVAHILRFNPHASLLKRQAQKTLSERLENPTQRFIKNRKVQKIPGKILLVDDFKTTGRTLSYASQVLGHLGVSEIHIFCLGMVATKHDLG
jgi:predicted amidophosphoribosyltransferase